MSQTSEPKPPLRRAVDLPGDKPLESGNSAALRPATPVKDLVPAPMEDNPPAADKPDEAIPRRHSGARYWLWSLVAVLMLSVAELVLFVRSAFQDADILAGLWLVVLTAIVGLAASQLVHEWRGLRQLKRREQQSQQSRDILQGPEIGVAQPLCQDIAASLPDSAQSAVADWQAQLLPHYNDKETLVLFEHKVLSRIDAHCVGLITQHASASAVLIAVSPFALLDMAIVLWRNLKLMRQISEAYGMRLSYWGRIGLLRSVFKTMLYAGASEILADAGNYALSTGLTGKLSTRLAQGFGAGVLTTRIGLKTLQQVRPLPYIEGKAPGLNDISAKVLEDLKHRIL